MKTFIVLASLISIYITAFAQKKYYDFNFERTDTTGKKIVQWEGDNRGVLFTIDPAMADSGKNCLNTYIINPGGHNASYHLVLPKSLYAGMRSISIAVKIQMRSIYPNAGLWCKVKRNSELLAHASTYKGMIPFPDFGYIASTGTNPPVSPFTWMAYNLDLSFEKDPSEVMIGIYLAYDRAWFDNIRIIVNGKPVTDMAFEMSDQ